MKHLIFIIAISFISCGQNSSKQKELELKEKELELKERELELKEKEISPKKDISIIDSPKFQNEKGIRISPFFVNQIPQEYIAKYKINERIGGVFLVETVPSLDFLWNEGNRFNEIKNLLFVGSADDCKSGFGFAYVDNQFTKLKCASSKYKNTKTTGIFENSTYKLNYILDYTNLDTEMDLTALFVPCTLIIEKKGGEKITKKIFGTQL